LGGAALVLLHGACGACARAAAPAAPRPSNPPPQLVLSEPAGWPYWQSPSFVLRPSREAARSVEEAPEPLWLASDEQWRPIAGALVTKVRTSGLVVRRTGKEETGIGRFYEERVRRHAPILITLDALFAVSHLVFARVASDVETTVTRPELSAVLRRLDARLGAEAPRARPDLHEGYRIARTAVAVALALSEPGYGVPEALADVVSQETVRIRGHAGLATSPLFGVPVDYGAFAPRGPIGSPLDPRVGAFQAAEWLGDAPFLFVGKGEPGGVGIDIGMARAEARAALLLARLLHNDGDAEAAPAFARMTRLDRFMLGDADDFSPRQLSELARRTGIDLRGGDDIVDAFKLDRFRRLAAKSTPTPGPLEPADGGGGGEPPTGPRTMRIVPLRASADGRVLQRLVSPFVGPLRTNDAGALPTLRRSPSALEVGAWLGSPIAREAVVARGDFDYPGFETGFLSLVESKPQAEPLRHASAYASWLDALSTWLGPSEGDKVAPRAPSPSADRRRLRSALAAWTFLRHDALPFAHDALQPEPQPAPPLAPPPPLASLPSTHPVEVFVDPHPEAIAALLGAVRQLHFGCTALEALRDDALSFALAVEVDGILSLALEASVREWDSDPALADLEPDLAQIPARIAALEAWAGSAAEPVVVDVHFDATSGNVLEEGTGAIEELFTRVRDPVARRSVLAVGATIPRWEFLSDGANRLDDAAWKMRLQQGHAPERDMATEPERVEE
jgi:hypothetical protein